MQIPQIPIVESTLWQLWQAVKSPPTLWHPLYKRGVSTAFRINNLLSCTLIFGVLLFIMPLVVMISTVMGAIAAATSSSAVSQEREAERFDLLAATAEGTFGASWLLGLGAVHRRDAYRRLQSWQTWVFRWVFIVAGVLFLESAALLSRTTFNAWDVLALPIDIALILVAFYVDHMQALTLGVLVGLLTPTLAHDRIGAQTGAVLFYLFLRVMTLVAAFALIFAAVPLFRLLPDIAPVTVLLRMFQFGLFAFINEVVTVVVWNAVKTRLLADDDSLRRWHLPAG